MAFIRTYNRVPLDLSKSRRSLSGCSSLLLQPAFEQRRKVLSKQFYNQSEILGVTPTFGVKFLHSTARNLQGILPWEKSDLLTYLYESESVAEETIIFTDAEDESQNLTKADLRRLTRLQISGWRQLLGARPGFTVTCNAFNSVLYAALFHAVVGAQGIWSGVNPAYTTAELTQHLSQTKSEYIITDEGRLDRVLQAASKAGIARENIIVLPGTGRALPDNVTEWKKLLSYGETDWPRLDNDRVKSDTVIALQPTSGTTGRPKLTMRTHKTHIAECESHSQIQRRPYRMRMLVSLPFFHGYCGPIVLQNALRFGLHTFCMRQFQHDDFFEAIKRHLITDTCLTPFILTQHLTNPSEQRKRLVQSLCTIYTGGASLNRDTQKAVTKVLSPGGRILQIYGFTEVGWCTGFDYSEEDETGSIGRVMSYCEAKVVNQAGQKVPDGVYGELCIRSAASSPGYMHDPGASSNTLTSDGWTRSGDLCRIQDGKIYLQDRLKDMIKARGWSISPCEIETVLLSHVGIKDAAIVGVTTDDASSEVPRAHIVRASDCNLDAEAVKKFLLQHLASFKVKDCQIHFCESLPRNSTGKLLKRLLKDEAPI